MLCNSKNCDVTYCCRNTGVASYLRLVPETILTQIYCAFTHSLWKVLKHHPTANQNQLFLYQKDILTASFSKLQQG